MTMTTSVAVPLSESLQALVDSRLDTIDRMLMGRVPRQDRLSIVREVEAQVFDLLQERDGEDYHPRGRAGRASTPGPARGLSPRGDGCRAEVVAHDAPEVAGCPTVAHGRSQDREGQRHPGAADDIGGFAFSPLDYLIAVLLDSEIVLIVMGFGTILLTLIGATVSYRPGDLFTDGKHVGRGRDW